MLNENSQIGHERAERLKSVRLLANLKRDEFAKLAEVSPTTVSYWENVTHTGLTEEGARKSVKAFAKVNIVCTVPWLMFGTGDAPHVKGQQPKAESSPIPNKAGTELDKEVSIFQAINNTVLLEASDDSMSPIFLQEDLVGGIWRNPVDIAINERMTFIVEFNNNLLLRKIRPAGLNKYDLYAMCLDPNSTIPFEIKGVGLTRIAPVTRLWRNG